MKKFRLIMISLWLYDVVLSLLVLGIGTYDFIRWGGIFWPAVALSLVCVLGTIYGSLELRKLFMPPTFSESSSESSAT